MGGCSYFRELRTNWRILVVLCTEVSFVQRCPLYRGVLCTEVSFVQRCPLFQIRGSSIGDPTNIRTSSSSGLSHPFLRVSRLSIIFLRISARGVVPAVEGSPLGAVVLVVERECGWSLEGGRRGEIPSDIEVSDAFSRRVVLPEEPVSKLEGAPYNYLTIIGVLEGVSFLLAQDEDFKVRASKTTSHKAQTSLCKLNSCHSNCRTIPLLFPVLISAGTV